MKRILAFGNPVYDLITTPSLQRSDRLLSGCSTNACLAASKLGEQSTLVGTVGPDYAEQLQSDLRRWGIESQLFSSKETGGFRLIYDQRGDRELSIIGNADQIPLSANGHKKVDFVLLGPILGEISVELVQQIKKNTLAPILLDPQGLLRELSNDQVIHKCTTAFKTIAGLSTIVKANEVETQVVTNINPRQRPEDAVKALHEYGPQISIVTLAEAGSVIYDGRQIYYIPPYSTDALDPTGAGDTYAAGFMVKYLENPGDLQVVGCFASAVASIMVENSGPEFPLTRAAANQRATQLLDGPARLKLS
jgi:sugar/nucleoside kinase (ribokinase family)